MHVIAWPYQSKPLRKRDTNTEQIRNYPPIPQQTLPHYTVSTVITPCTPYSVHQEKQKEPTNQRTKTDINHTIAKSHSISQFFPHRPPIHPFPLNVFPVSNRAILAGSGPRPSDATINPITGRCCQAELPFRPILRSTHPARSSCLLRRSVALREDYRVLGFFLDCELRGFVGLVQPFFFSLWGGESVECILMLVLRRASCFFFLFSFWFGGVSVRLSWVYTCLLF